MNSIEEQELNKMKADVTAMESKMKAEGEILAKQLKEGLGEEIKTYNPEEEVKKISFLTKLLSIFK